MDAVMSTQRILDSIEKSQHRQAALPEFRPGDSIKVWAKIREGEKTRLQAFEGVCIRRVSKGARSTFTVRKISYGVGVERIFPDNSPNIDKVEVIARGRVHQSRLYYLRDSVRQGRSHQGARVGRSEGRRGRRARTAPRRPPKATPLPRRPKESRRSRKRSGRGDQQLAIEPPRIADEIDLLAGDRDDVEPRLLEHRAA